VHTNKGLITKNINIANRIAIKVVYTPIRGDSDVTKAEAIANTHQAPTSSTAAESKYLICYFM
jgi:hypothetical protein